MFARKRPRRHAATTPIYDQTTKGSMAGRLIRLAILLAPPLVALAVFGQPALRIQYSWHGHREAPIYTHCIYLALDGWHDIRPPYGIGQCPLVTLLPIDLMAFLAGR